MYSTPIRKQVDLGMKRGLRKERMVFFFWRTEGIASTCMSEYYLSTIGFVWG